MSFFADLYAGPPALLAHAAVLLVIAPLMAAAAAALAPNARWAWLIALGGSAMAFWMALGVAGEVARNGVIVYAMGGFAPPLGITFRIDALGALFTVLISGMAVVAAVFSGFSLKAEIRESKRGLFQAGFLLCQAGLLGMSATGDAFNAFVFLEISSIGTYALIAAGGVKDRRPLPAAFNYLIIGTVGATLFVIGVGLLYGATGTLNMADMGARLAGQDDNRAVLAGFALIVVGLGIKAAMFPLHGWLPGAYAHAPSLMAVFLSATATKAAIYLIVRFAYTVFNPGAAVVVQFMEWIVAPMAGAAIIVCSLQAMFQTELRRMLAYSSVAQVGYILLGVAMGTAAGLTGGLLHVVNHSLMKGALFMAIGAMALSTPAARLSDFSGAMRTAPWTVTAFGIAGFSLMGVPLTAGFLSKWRLVEAAIASGWWWAVAVIAVSSLLALVYVGRMLEVMIFRAPAAGQPEIREAPLGVLIPLWLLAGLCVWFGVDAAIPEGLARTSAAAVLGVR